jgi:hypothetical protein
VKDLTLHNQRLVAQREEREAAIARMFREGKTDAEMRTTPGPTLGMELKTIRDKRSAMGLFRPGQVPKKQRAAPKVAESPDAAPARHADSPGAGWHS